MTDQAEIDRLAAGALRATAYAVIRWPGSGAVDHVLDAMLCALAGGAQDDTSLGSTLPVNGSRWQPVFAAAHEAVVEVAGVQPSSLLWDARGARVLRRAADLLDG